MAAPEVADASCTLGGAHEQAQPERNGSCACSVTAEDLSSTVCAAVKAVLRKEMELVRRDQAEAAERREEKVHGLLAEQEQRLQAAVLQTRAAPRARGPADAEAAGSPSPDGSTGRALGGPAGSPITPHVSPNPRRAGLKLPLRARHQRSPSSLSAPAGRTPNEFSPRDVEAPRTPNVSVSCHTTDAEDARAFTEGQVSLNSPSPAGTREWRHHMKGRITQKISRGGTEVWIARPLGRLGRRLEAFVGRMQSEASVKSRRWSEGVVDSTGFEMLCGIFILANAIAIGCRQDALTRAAMGDAGTPWDDTWADTVNYVLVSVFVLEIAFRMFAKRWRYLFSREWKWNVADSVLAAYCIIQLAVFRAYEPYFQIIRIFRLVRVVRAMRAVRVFRDVRLMVCSLSQSMVPLFSAFALLFVVIYIFSICFMHGAASYAEGRGAMAGVVSELRTNYGSLSVTMYTLLLAVSNGRDWNELAAPLGEIHWAFQTLFMFYVLFVVIGVLNVLTSVFVERVHELSKLDRDLATQGELASQEAFLTQMRTIFEEVDDEKYGRITWHKFRDYLQSDKARAFLATQQLDTSDAANFFSLMEVDDAGAVSIEEFALGCMRLRGPAKSFDVALLLREAKVARKNAKMLRNLGARLDRLCRNHNVPHVDGNYVASSSASFYRACSASPPESAQGRLRR